MLCVLSEPVLMSYNEANEYYQKAKIGMNTWKFPFRSDFEKMFATEFYKLHPKFIKDGKYWVTNTFIPAEERVSTGVDVIYDKGYAQIVEVKDGKPVLFRTHVDSIKKTEKAYFLPTLFPYYFTNNTKAPHTLSPGQQLKPGEKLTSENGAYILTLQEDGNLCVYNNKNGVQGAYVWGTMKHGFKDARFQLNANGNLIVYSGKNDIKWSSNTGKKGYNTPTKLVLENDGSLKLYNVSGQVVWTNK